MAGAYCGETENTSGYGYVCTENGPHTEHVASGLHGERIYAWLVAAAPVPDHTPSEFQVKIWYESGAYEEIDHAPAHVATTVYAEAEDSDRVVAAEIHGCATHKLHRSFRRELDSAPVVG